MVRFSANFPIFIYHKSPGATGTLVKTATRNQHGLVAAGKVQTDLQRLSATNTFRRSAFRKFHIYLKLAVLNFRENFG
jgi:hypothetical protein